MDIETLIHLVYARPPLWDKNNKLRGDRNVIDKFWRQISIEMKDDENKLRKKWKYLRDQFSVEMGKFPPGDDSYRPKWVHFDSLIFLKDMVKPRELIKKHSKKHAVSRQRERRRRSSSLQVSEDQEECAEEQDSPANNYQSDSEPDISLMDYLDQNASSAPSKRKNYAEDNGNSNYFGSVPKPKKCLIGGTTEDEDVESLFFFKSLLPHVRKIPEHKILSFRNRIQEVVEEFAYPRDIDVKYFKA